MRELQRNPLGYQQLTVSTVAVGLTLPTSTIKTGDLAGTGSVTRRAGYSVIRCATAAVRWRDDGTAPTATVGIPLNVGDELDYDGDASAIKFIRSGGADATLDISYYD